MYAAARCARRAGKYSSKNPDAEHEMKTAANLEF